MALDGVDTAALESYSDANANNPRYIAAREEKLRIEDRSDIDRLAGAVTITLQDGRTVAADANVGIPASDSDAQWFKLSDKFDALSMPLIGEERARTIRNQIAALDDASDIGTLMQAAI